jgi:hypothetical protein
MPGKSRRVAIAGLLLPYVLNLTLIGVFATKIGIETYRTAPNSWHLYGKIIVYLTWSALALSALLPIPYAVQFIKERTRNHSRGCGCAVRCIGYSLAYIGIIAANGIAVIALHMMAWTSVGGVW